MTALATRQALIQADGIASESANQANLQDGGLNPDIDNTNAGAHLREGCAAADLQPHSKEEDRPASPDPLPPITDPIIRALCEALRARKAFPAGHTFAMTNPVLAGQMKTVGTCSCTHIFSFPWGDNDRMDAAIEAHWQRFDHLTEKVDGRGNPIETGDRSVLPKKGARRAPGNERASPKKGAGLPVAETVSPEPAPCGVIANAEGAGSTLSASEAGGVAIASEPAPVFDASSPGAGEIQPPAEDDPYWNDPFVRQLQALAWREEKPDADVGPGPVSVDQVHAKIALYSGSCLDALPMLDENSIDSCVCDPPYHLTTGKKGGTGPASLNENSPAGRARISTGFMGKAWDGGDVAFQVETWRQVFRVLKPGAHLIAFSGTRTYHRMVCAIEDAGFEIRDQIGWLYGSGFPKSLDVSKAIDKAAGAEREIVSEGEPVKRMIPGADQNVGGWEKNDGRVFVPTETAPATDAAKAWDGWGTALKPSQEPVVVARKPLSEKTVTANVLKWGTGAINVDGCRVETADNITPFGSPKRSSGGIMNATEQGREQFDQNPQGRWPANIIHDGSEEVLAGFPDTTTGGRVQHAGEVEVSNWCANEGRADPKVRSEYARDGDSGSAARFFYTAKADDDDRVASKHPTVKPVDLMQYLVRLVTPPRGVVLDPFAGTGTTGEAAFREGFGAVLIEREAEYQDDIRRRVRLMLAGPEERSREIIKEKLKDKPLDAGPLFGGSQHPPPRR